jgi:hypothetical protein
LGESPKPPSLRPSAEGSGQASSFVLLGLPIVQERRIQNLPLRSWIWAVPSTAGGEGTRGLRAYVLEFSPRLHRDSERQCNRSISWQVQGRLRAHIFGPPQAVCTALNLFYPPTAGMVWVWAWPSLRDTLIRLRRPALRLPSEQGIEDDTPPGYHARGLAHNDN